MRSLLASLLSCAVVAAQPAPLRVVVGVEPAVFAAKQSWPGRLDGLFAASGVAVEVVAAPCADEDAVVDLAALAPDLLVLPAQTDLLAVRRRIKVRDVVWMATGPLPEGFAPPAKDGVIALAAALATASSPASVGHLGISADGAFTERGHHAVAHLVTVALLPRLSPEKPWPKRHTTLPLIDLAAETARQVIVDREAGQYLGHPTTTLLADGKTMLCVYPKGHGRGPIVFKRSGDGGRTWSERLPTPASWATSQETPTLYRVRDPRGGERLLVFSGLHPIRVAASDDAGATFSELAPIFPRGGIVAMGALATRRDHTLVAWFHDDGRFFLPQARAARPVVFTLYQTTSADGGRTWTEPTAILRDVRTHPCEPGFVLAPDGAKWLLLLRENSRRRNSLAITSTDEGATWSAPRELPASLTGDRHVARYAPDGRLVVTFRDTGHVSPTYGDWVAWVGTWNDLVGGGDGQYRVRLMDNTKDADCAYPGLELLPDGTFVTTTYGHWSAGEAPYVVSVRFTLAELDRLAAQ